MTEEMLISKDEVFADPTLDVSFKMLFGQNKNKDILISLLNSLLNFHGKDTIIDVEISPNELTVSNISSKKKKWVSVVRLIYYVPIWENSK